MDEIITKSDERGGRTVPLRRLLVQVLRHIGHVPSGQHLAEDKAQYGANSSTASDADAEFSDATTADFTQ